MKITHHTNSFIEIEANNFKIVCDPWLNPANHGGWTISPIIPESVYRKALTSADLLYISHLHSDHLDEKLLSKYSQYISADVLIPYYANKHLYNRLKKILPNNNHILLCPKEQFSPVDNLDIYIYPQQASSQTNQPSQESIFRYELDSSLLVIDRNLDISFFNQVDNPLSIQNIHELRNYLRSLSVNRLDCLCMAVGAASQYPQCFLGINLNEAKNLLLARLLEDFKSKLTCLNPKFFFPAGGDYDIGGSYSLLNKYKAVPSSSDLSEALKSCTDSKYLDLRGGKTLELSSCDYSKERLSEYVALSRTPRVEKSLHSECEYLTSTTSSRQATLNQLFDDAKKGFESKIRSIESISGADCMPQYSFILYPSAPIAVEKDYVLSVKDSSTPSLVFLLDSLSENLSNDNVIEYEFHMSEFDFNCLLTRQYSWNQFVSGSNCLMRRSQNLHIAWHEMLLNLFVL